jgi:hypothetical protein
MTGPKAAPLPLVFLLAMAADVSAGGTMTVPEERELWHVGSLSRLLDDFEANHAADPAVGRPTSDRLQLTQWSNFRNCFSGNWRNC